MIAKVFSHEMMPSVKALIEEGHQVTIKTSGMSMWPFYKHHQTMVVLDKPEHLKKYDVVLYKHEDQYLLHRIIKIKDKFWIRGDFNLAYEYIDKDLVFAKVISHKTSKININERNIIYLFKVWLWQVLKPLRPIIKKLRR